MRLFSVVPCLLALSCGHADRIRLGPVSMPIQSPQTQPAMSFHELSATDIQGQLVRFDRYKGSKVIVVNTASECGYTPQYAQLQELYDNYKDQGLVVIGFPCNDFGGQEPGSEETIAAFCQKNYGVTFPMMAKVDIKGEQPHAVFNWLMHKSQNGVLDHRVKWNFHKFLIDEQGRLLDAFPSGVSPLDDKILRWVQG